MRLILGLCLLVSSTCFGQFVHTLLYLSDLEGSWPKLSSFYQLSGGFWFDEEGVSHLKEGYLLVYGGDAPDRYLGTRKVLRELNRHYREAPDRNIRLVGNRDAKELRLPVELSVQALRFRPFWYAFLDHDRWTQNMAQTKAERLKYMLSNNMGSPNAFEHRRDELIEEGVENPTDDDVAQSFLDSLSPGGESFEYLQNAQIAFRWNHNTFVHGGLTWENMLNVPGDPTPAPSIDEFIVRLNHWYKDQFREWADFNKGIWRPYQRRGGQALIDYPMPLVGEYSKQDNVITGRNADHNNNPYLPSQFVRNLYLKEGAERFVFGHTPTGDTGVILRTTDGRIEVLSADNTFSRKGLNPLVVKITDEGRTLTVQSHYERSPGVWVPTLATTHLGEPSTLGARTRSRGDVVVSQTLNQQYILFRHTAGYKIEYRELSAEELAHETLEEPLGPDFPLSHNDKVGVLVASMDPPTLTDRKYALDLIKKHELTKLFVLFRVRGEAPYMASVVERQDLFRLMFDDEELQNIEIRAEPPDGEVQFIATLKRLNQQTEIFSSEKGCDRHSTKARGELTETGHSELLHPRVQEHVSLHALYKLPELSERINAYTDFLGHFRTFQETLFARFLHYPLRPIAPPDFTPGQSRRAWLELFIQHIIASNELNALEAGQIANAARIIYSHPDRVGDFPTAQLKDGAPSQSCLRYLLGRVY